MNGDFKNAHLAWMEKIAVVRYAWLFFIEELLATRFFIDRNTCRPYFFIITKKIVAVQKITLTPKDAQSRLLIFRFAAISFKPLYTIDIIFT